MLPLTLRTPRAPRPLRRSGVYPRRLLEPVRTAPDSARTTPPNDQLFVLARDALVLIDLVSDTMMRWNPAAEVLFGYPAAEAVGKTIDLLLPTAVARLHRERIAHYRRTGEADVLTPRGPVTIPARARSGRELRVELSMAPVGVPGSGPRLLLLTFRDASCEQRAEVAALEAARADASRHDFQMRLNSCEELLDATTRDLAGPVARARRSAARLARIAAEPEGRGGRRLALLAQVVEGRTEDLQRSLLQIADAAAIQTGKFELGRERVNLVPLVGRLVNALRSRSTAHRLKLGAPQGLTATCDPQRLTAVLEHIIECAVRRNPRGCWIDVDLRRPLAGTARIEVRDYGRPLSARELERLLNPLIPDRGWFVSRHIVERHGGTLGFDFPPEGGLRVILSLPTNRAR